MSLIAGSRARRCNPHHQRPAWEDPEGSPITSKGCWSQGALNAGGRALQAAVRPPVTSATAGMGDGRRCTSCARFHREPAEPPPTRRRLPWTAQPLSSFPRPGRSSTRLVSLWAGFWPATRATPGPATPVTCGLGSPGAPRWASRSSPFAAPTSSSTPGGWRRGSYLARATIGRRLFTVVGFYRYAVIDGYLTESPAEHVRRPKIDTESTTLGLDRMELGAFLAQAAAAGPVDHALACLLGLLGLRVSEACGIDIEHLGTERGHRTVTGGREGVQGGGDPPAASGRPSHRRGRRRACERSCAPLPFRPAPRPLRGTRIVRRLARRAGIVKRISPHSLRHSFITAALDAGVPLRDVQIAARHADPRTTTRYDRARNNLDRRARYVVTAFVAGAS